LDEPLLELLLDSFFSELDEDEEEDLRPEDEDDF